MIEFKDGKKFLQVKKDRFSPSHEALVLFSENGYQSTGVYISREMYHLLQQAMPHIGAIVEGE